MTEPKVSLVMTVLNEERSLSRFLESLSAQTRRPDEVVVVDGGSTDRTVELLRAWGARVLVEPGANISRGRNLAFEVADHELVAVTDAGTVLDPAWLEGLLDASAAGTRLVAGWYEPVWHTRTERMLASVVMPLLAEVRDPDAFLPSSRSLLVTKTAWREAGGYPEWLDYCEDLVFDFALKEAGHRFAFAPQAVARWSARPTLRAYAKQYYRYARGDGKADL